ncbi:MAG: hypothetical protein QOH81_2908 [Sphingomonadales bacterium]|jgi:hypothetical protein|nr:hypothetical protein [Sphingomonadales bacterium]
MRPVPAACAGVPTMLIDDELRLLESLTDEYYRDGAIVDAGCFLGGSTIALASGLRRNLRRRGQPERPLIHSYDLFQIEDWTRGIYFPESAKAGDSTRALFDRNISDHAPLIEVHEGDITRSRPPEGPVDILFVDVAKHWTTCDWITANLFPLLVPGRSVVVQQDYLYPEWTGWLHVTMEYYADEFERLCDTGSNSVAFLHTKAFAPGRLRPRLVADLPTAEKTILMDRAASRFSGRQAELLRSAKRHFVSMLDDG